MLLKMKAAYWRGYDFFNSVTTNILTLLPTFFYTPKPLKGAANWSDFKNRLEQHYPRWFQGYQTLSMALMPLAMVFGVLLWPIMLPLHVFSPHFTQKLSHFFSDFFSLVAVRKAVIYIAVGISALLAGVAGGLVAIGLMKAGGVAALSTHFLGTWALVLSEWKMLMIANGLFALVRGVSAYQNVQTLTSEEYESLLKELPTVEKDKCIERAEAPDRFTLTMFKHHFINKGDNKSLKANNGDVNPNSTATQGASVT